MNYWEMAQFVGFLGIRLRYWAIIVIVVLVLLALAYSARGRNA